MDIKFRITCFQVWATPTTNMQCKWLGERVSKVNAWKMTKNFVYQRCEQGWGPNATFKFPKNGGTGSLWKSVAQLLPKSNVQYNCEVNAFDLDEKIVTTKGGDRIKYNKLITTIPLDILLTKIGRDDLACRLTYSSSHIIGIGLRGSNPTKETSWMYFPESDAPFYR